MTAARPALRTIAAPLAALAALALATPAGAEVFEGDYTVTFLGLTVARSTVQSRIEDGKFSIDGTMSSAGIAALFDRTKGTASASGAVRKGETRPLAYRVEYKEGKRRQTTAIRFGDGTVAGTENDPPLKKRGDDWVPVQPDQLKGALDPLSAGIVPAGGPGEVCKRTLRIFDGEFLLDATLRPADPKRAFAGYGDRAVTCQVTVKPVGGYRKGRKALEYLEKRSRILVAFTPLGETGLYAPVHATVGTQIGTVTVKARQSAK